VAASLLISVVDDDPASREAMSGLVRSMGHRVAGFASAADFLASGELERTEFLIVDSRMPGMTGLELHRRLVAAGIAVPTAIVTAYPADPSRLQMMAAGITVLEKPLSPADLAACLETAMRG
jgi:FixJ family two-component response regulator